ncbi:MULTISPECIES: UDP-N-acetylglucosamine 2-epimerase [Carboxydocella]|uniref:GDP/UDP-N,N'-diacetylbacillosamine 2-epimerase (Hydrolysing) n=2 Tax=Carboxydocella TaxID=178898 RepID=A0A1T4QW87_9FIRM|nr:MULTISPECIES: UDP-N-acetylglucosamine 2-epimerase [Carboxydocella]AVX21681.1 UDP-N-acetylglucosamine 2-epimerase (non-hydrolysing) [Carboxydocella thermautotrophica]AVX32092.1 GDP/UDP-N,N'-diacetylbacillosamine 2-epimerase [Carboxydocella thermautotrophica]SKA07925.1 GDP/UDP-N,N'-diacetylbacillosamine 2-epimerase (hydrolysing) [Carboxydocella sporoproducens DSM 16521]GAW27672.1 UDP-N-acetyl glucosamine 2-epimerase [Carboxydocella sp. ULO1]GAW31867.1 UDP-N-acetyl glucosamine 2-epimerase [Car
MRKIAVITGTRADYGIYKPILTAISQHQELSLQLIVTGMHLHTRFGRTIEQIRQDGFAIAAEVPILSETDGPDEMAKAIGRAILGLTEAIGQLEPDLGLVLGDRGEMLAAAIVFSHLGIPVVHLHGGEVSGTIDESVRHAITKLAHIHFPATESSRERLIKMGEKPENIYVVGAAGLDYIINKQYTAREILVQKYRIDEKRPLLLVLQHPVNWEYTEAGWQMEQTMRALERLQLPTILIHPNSDAGHLRMLEIIRQYQNRAWLQTFPSIPSADFLGLMQIAAVLIGNSSSGIIEAPSCGLPVINIGSRQAGRERATNVIDVDYNEEMIYAAIIKALKDGRRTYDNPYGDGKTGPRVADLLARIEINRDLLNKQIAY